MQFTEFSQTMIAALPNFPSLEDYWPEADWGDIMFVDGVDVRPMFYGGVVQRITDFIEAFRILYGEGTPAMSDMRNVLRMQSTLLETVGQAHGPRSNNTDLGHIEVPPEWFWNAVKGALPIESSVSVTPGLLATMGAPAGWHNGIEFGDSVMKGEVLPWIGVRVGKKLLPLSLRNAPAAVLDYWSGRTKVASQDGSLRFAAFLDQRISKGSLIQGPLQVVSRQSHASRMVDTVVLGKDRHYLIIFATAEELVHIDKSISELKLIIDKNTDWAFLRPGTPGAIQLRDRKGATPTLASLDVVVVAGFVTTKPVSIRVPKDDLRIVTLVDAVTLFDAMKDVDELTRFLVYETRLQKMELLGMSDLMDLFGSFRDSQGQIIGGAIKPSLIVLDPHWGSNWRYSQLREYWSGAPKNFPDDRSAWDTEKTDAGASLRRVVARNLPRLDWSCRLGACTLHFVLDADLMDLRVEDGQVLETFVHCAADCLAERAALVSSMVAPHYKRVVIECLACTGSLVTLPEQECEIASGKGLLADWRIVRDRPPWELRAQLTVNLARVRGRLEQAKDASFEVECATALLELISPCLRGRPLTPDERDRLSQTSSRRPRFVMKRIPRAVDVPDYAAPESPTLENYKVARRSLAELLQSQGVAPDRYELGKAKTLIDAARSAYRDMVHERLRTFDHDSLIIYCVQQIDKVCTEYDRRLTQVRQSLKHEVDYDREQLLAESHEQYIRNSRNFRYALEAALFLTDSKSAIVDSPKVLEVIAMIDWQFVLYQASDVLHNGIDVGGLLVDDEYIPEVFYSEVGGAQQHAFAREMAALRLGVGVAREDQIKGPQTDDGFLKKLDSAFLDDIGFTFTNLLQIVATLVSWVAAGGASELAFGYMASAHDIVGVACSTHNELDEASALRAVDFLVLEGSQIRQLIGRKSETGDVPVWEHSKRAARYAIKPLIRLSDGRLIWGAAMTDRAARIWTGSVTSGYLPAEFPWPRVRRVVGSAKKVLEDALEDSATAICVRSTPYALKDVDFKRRFPERDFPDVGDFDVLAYWPDGNRWLIAECKYNRPAFCLKDARRLRDRVYGGNGEVGQFIKIERRRQFFSESVALIRRLLRWPDPTVTSPSITEVYICKDLHWWLRFPPYEVPTKFTQIDTLDSWLSANGFMRSGSDVPDPDKQI